MAGVRELQAQGRVAMVVDGVAYDFTDFTAEHPGGELRWLDCLELLVPITPLCWPHASRPPAENPSTVAAPCVSALFCGGE